MTSPDFPASPPFWRDPLVHWLEEFLRADVNEHGTTAAACLVADKAVQFAALSASAAPSAAREGEAISSHWLNRVRTMLRSMADNEPETDVADGVTCWMIWKKWAAELLELERLAAPRPVPLDAPASDQAARVVELEAALRQAAHSPLSDADMASVGTMIEAFWRVRNAARTALGPTP